MYVLCSIFVFEISFLTYFYIKNQRNHLETFFILSCFLCYVSCISVLVTIPKSVRILFPLILNLNYNDLGCLFSIWWFRIFPCLSLTWRHLMAIYIQLFFVSLSIWRRHGFGSHVRDALRQWWSTGRHAKWRPCSPTAANLSVAGIASSSVARNRRSSRWWRRLRLVRER